MRVVRCDTCLPAEAILQRLEQCRQVFVRPCADRVPEARCEERLREVQAAEVPEPSEVGAAVAPLWPPARPCKTANLSSLESQADCYNDNRMCRFAM